MQNKQSSGGISGNFLLGIIIGAVVTLLFTTKKGKQVLRMLSEESFDKLTDLESLLARAEKELEMKDKVRTDPEVEENKQPAAYEQSLRMQMMTKPSISEELPLTPQAVSHESALQFNVEDGRAIETQNKYTNDGALRKTPPAGRRFFRGIPKR